MRRIGVVLLVAISGAAPMGQEVSLEYRVKAAYLYNLVKYVEWPDETRRERILICVAGQNPFGAVLDDLVRNERIRGKPLAAEVILEPRSDCDIVFTPKTSNVAAYLRAAAGTATLTVGEAPRYLEQGGIVNFFSDGTRVRFEISRSAAERARLRISSRLLQLARIADPSPDER